MSAGEDSQKASGPERAANKLERYKNWANYERHRANNLETAYHNLPAYR
jgi:hypothetical protein